MAPWTQHAPSCRHWCTRASRPPAPSKRPVSHPWLLHALAVCLHHHYAVCAMPQMPRVRHRLGAADTPPNLSHRQASAVQAPSRGICAAHLFRGWGSAIHTPCPRPHACAGGAFREGATLIARSSANVEDLAGMSGAGLYESLAGVPAGARPMPTRCPLRCLSRTL